MFDSMVFVNHAVIYFFTETTGSTTKSEAKFDLRLVYFLILEEGSGHFCYLSSNLFYLKCKENLI